MLQFGTRPGLHFLTDPEQDVEPLPPLPQYLK